MKDRRHEDGPGDNSMIWICAVYIVAIAFVGYGVWRLIEQLAGLL